jgi:hypothetical protein
VKVRRRGREDRSDVAVAAGAPEDDAPRVAERLVDGPSPWPRRVVHADLLAGVGGGMGVAAARLATAWPA